MPSPAAQPTILLVEDSEDDAFFFRWALRKCETPCSLVVASDGSEAIRHLEEARAGGRLPDLVYLDLKIPTSSGFQVLAWIGEQHFDPPLDVAVLSGSDHASDVARAHALGATGYFVKPLSTEQLRARLQAWQKKREAGGRQSTEVRTPAASQHV